MSGIPIPVVFAAAAVSAALVILWFTVSSARAPSQATRTAENLRRAPEGSDLRQILLSHSAGQRAVGPAMRFFAGQVRRLTPMGWTEALARRVLRAGVAARWPTERVLVAKTLLIMAVVAIAILRPPSSLIGVLGWVTVGAVAFFTPDLLLANKAHERKKAIQNALPDTLDQITISVEAGLGFEAAMARAARTGEGPLNEELSRALSEIQLGAARHEALRGLVDRTHVPELRHFVLAILQAESYGLPVAQVLRVQAKELRVKRRQRAEERALKIPVKIVFPLALCILPTLFIVILGPAAIRIYEFFTTTVRVDI
jgi:tight adherence protein C